MQKQSKGVILCGGQGTRLRPATATINKHMIPIVNMPMVTFPIHTLYQLGITDILIVTGGDHIGTFAEFLGDGSAYGVSLTYKVQKEAGGIAQALALAEDFYGGYDGPVVAILGDNIFGDTLAKKIIDLAVRPNEALVILKEVEDPRRFGVATTMMVDGERYVDFVEEKPTNPPADGYAVTGLYTYPRDVFSVIDTLKPSLRGELEITDVTKHYVQDQQCKGLIYNGFWSDAGTPESLLEVCNWYFGKKSLT